MGAIMEPEVNEKQQLQPQCSAKTGPSMPVEAYATLAMPHKWSTGLFDCCAHPGGGALGCVSLLLPCVQYGVLAEQVPKDALPCAGEFGIAAGTFLCLDVVAGLAQCSLWPGVSLLPTSGLLHMRLRRHLRDKYAIEGSWKGDLCAAWWCGPCALAQETREIVIRTAAERAAAVTSPMSAPGPAYMVGNLLLPHPAATAATTTAAANPFAAMPTAATVAAPAATSPMAPLLTAADVAGAAPAMGMPVHPVPPTHVATVTLGGKSQMESC